MPGKFVLFVAVVPILGLIACAQPETETAPPAADQVEEEVVAAVEEELDPTVVDPQHYKTELDNDRVRILRIAYGPGEESVMHFHPDSVAVFLTDHLVQMTMPDGSTEEISTEAGETLFIPAGQHLPKNIADSAWELILVELK